MEGVCAVAIKAFEAEELIEKIDDIWTGEGLSVKPNKVDLKSRHYVRLCIFLFPPVGFDLMRALRGIHPVLIWSGFHLIL